MASRQDARSLWISIPNAGSFMRNLRKGRDALKRIVKNSKFREALERDVLKRKLKGTKLGMRYGRRSDLMRDCVPSATTAAVVSHGATPAPLQRYCWPHPCPAATTLVTHGVADTTGGLTPWTVCLRADGMGSVSRVGGCRYHMSDAIGAGALVCTKTTMGPLLRLPDPD